MKKGNPMTTARLLQQVEFIVEIDKLKKIYRQSLISDGSRDENDAEHSWHLAVMAMILSEYANDPALDILKVLKMVLIHDIVEIDAGDTFIYDVQGYTTKSDREDHAAARIFGLLPQDQKHELTELWQEFEQRQTAEAKFAAVLDRLEPLLLNSLTDGHTWKKHHITSSKVFARNEHTQEGSAVLYKYITELINDCIDKGYLKKDHQ